MKRICSLMMVAAALAGCGDGGGGGGPAPVVTGMYQIAYHTDSVAVAGGSQATCVGEGPAVTTPAYLTFVDDDFGGIGWGLCDTTDPISCSDEFYTFDDIDGVWQIGAATSAAYSGGLCTLYHAEGTVTLVSEEPRRVRLEVKEWNEYPSVAQDACTLEAAHALATQDACSEHLVIEATPL